MEQKMVYIAYRRSISRELASLIYMDLKANGYDVFFDVQGHESDNGTGTVLHEIASRTHFILIIETGTLSSCQVSGDRLLQEIEEAVRYERNIIPLMDANLNFASEISGLPAVTREVIQRKNVLPIHDNYFTAGLNMLRTRFLQMPIYAANTSIVKPQRTNPQSPRITSYDLMPSPFKWIDIPDKNYSLAKYALTTAQFGAFIRLGGYENSRWWTEEGWRLSQRRNWRLPELWSEKRITFPVAGISWYEADAYCQWLSAATGEHISLPTEAEWQYAAQGDDGRAYPWGNTWSSGRAKKKMGRKGYSTTTSVTSYEGKGDSPFGLVNMAGNVWEWCAAAPDSDSAPVRGGSAGSYHENHLKTTATSHFSKENRRFLTGCRLCRYD